MRVKRLSKRDRALHLLGQIVLRELEPHPWPPERKANLLTMHDLISDAMTAEEFELIHEGTFYAFISSADMESAPPPPIAEAPPGTEPIQTVEELLRALRDNMPSGVILGDDGRVFVAVLADPEPMTLWPVRQVAFVAEGSAARALLTQAHQANEKYDIRAFEELPLRYGPRNSMWVLADAPYAPEPATPGDEIPF